MNRAVFLDRDGVINKVILKDGKPFSPRKLEEFKLYENVDEFLIKSKNKNFLNIIVTNQPDIARGLMDMQTAQAMHEIIESKLAVDDIFICPHDDCDNCHCRKPKPGMITDAAEKWNIDLSNSFLIGDSWKDVQAGKAAGCFTILLDYPYNKNVEPRRRVADLNVANEFIDQ